jgi:hypothetical protein
MVRKRYLITLLSGYLNLIYILILPGRVRAILSVLRWLVVMTSIWPLVVLAPLKAFSIKESKMVCLLLLWLSSTKAPT